MWFQGGHALILPNSLHENKLTCQFLLASWMMFELQFVVVKMVSSTFAMHSKMLPKFPTNHGLDALFFKSAARHAANWARMPTLFLQRNLLENSRKCTPNGSSRRIKTKMICPNGTWALSKGQDGRAEIIFHQWRLVISDHSWSWSSAGSYKPYAPPQGKSPPCGTWLHRCRCTCWPARYGLTSFNETWPRMSFEHFSMSWLVWLERWCCHCFSAGLAAAEALVGQITLGSSSFVGWRRKH